MNMSIHHMQKYMNYIKNGDGAIGIKEFDEDWQPIGPQVLICMVQKGIIKIDDKTGGITLTALGKSKLLP